MGNPTSNELLERIHQILGNLERTYNIKETYVYKYCPWSGILAAALFLILSIENILKGYSSVQLVFSRDMIILIKHMADWGLIRQQNQT